MDNFIFQIQSIKSQIDNMKMQISYIEMQYDNMNMQFQGEQLINLGIQMLNTGLNSFNLGMSKAMTSLDGYFTQMKNISQQIINLININENILQPKMMQQQFMQFPIMNQLNMPNFHEKFEQKKINISLEVEDSTGLKINSVFNYGTKIKEVIEKFSKRIGKSKYNYSFLFNGKILDYNDERKIEDVLFDCVVLKAVEKGF